MVKGAKSTQNRSVPTSRTGRPPRPDDVRSARLILRAHPDLMNVLTVRARAAGVSRSRYVERLLIAWLNADPRNPKLDAVGKMSPFGWARKNATETVLGNAAKWERYNSAHKALFGVPLPDSDFEDQDLWWGSIDGMLLRDEDPED